MADNFSDIDWDDLNDLGKVFLDTIQAIDTRYSNLSKSQEKIRKELNLSNKAQKGLNDLAAELNQISEDQLKTKEGIKKFETTIGKAQSASKKLSAEIQKLEAKKIGASRAQIRDIEQIQKLKQEELNATNNLIESSKELLEISKSQNDIQKKINETMEGVNKGSKALLGTTLDNVASFAGLVKLISDADKSTTEVAKQLGISKAEARGIRADFNVIALTTNNSAINAESLSKSFLELGNNLGAVSGFTEDNLIAQTELTKQVGLQSEEASSLVGLGILNGKTNQEVTGEILDQVVALDKQTGIRLDGRKILAEVAKTEGQLAAQYGFNNKLIAQAVVLTKQYGLELKQAENIANNLLEFESSIENELSAELLTGKQLNLERARALSLAGDTAKAAEEVAQQFGSVEEFTSMNVLQQRELAKAVGLSTDELSDSIRKREILNRLGANRIEDLKNTTDEEGQVLYQQMLQQSAAEKFEQAVVKIQAAIGSLLEGPLGGLLDIMVAIADSAFLTVLAITAIGAISFVRILASLVPLITGLASGAVAAVTLSSALTFGLGAIAIIGGIAAILAAFGAFSNDAESNAQQAVADGIAPPGNGPFTITDSYGRTAITANGDGVAVSPNINQGGGSTQPIVIQNTFSNFQSAGPYALSETQRRQASPTFA
jgi:hypothetical protein